jgi:putative flippase GtrA
MTMTTATTLGRWMRFNGVGALGVAVQLATLDLLVRGGEIPIALTTVLAVEAAILHNFAWHQRWTWREVAVAGRREVLGRLVRFHALNGSVSLVGNVIITSVLAHAGVHLIAANAVAIFACSIVNFVATDRLVFRAAAVALVLAGSTPATIAASDDYTLTIADGPKPATLAAWDKYVAAIDARYNAPDKSFFALDTRGTANWRQRARNGEVPMVEIDPPSIPDGKLHHWAGAIYIPNTTVGAVVKRMQDYAGRESEFYQEVKASRLLARDGDRLKVFMRLYRGAYGMDATFNSEHAVEYRRLDAKRASSRSVSTKMAELADPGTPQEREKPAGTDTGFLWRLNAYWRFEQIGDGVLIECESASLSRDVPRFTGWLVGSIVEGVAKSALEGTLKSLRKFLIG